MVFDYEHPDQPFDYWLSQEEKLGEVVGTLPTSTHADPDTHILIRMSGPLFTPRKGKERYRHGGWETEV